LSTIAVARKNGAAVMVADALTTFDELKLPPELDAEPEKIFCVGDAAVGVVGFTAHAQVLENLLKTVEAPDFSSRAAIFELFRSLHPILKEEYFLNPEAEEGDPYESSQMALLVASPHGLFGVYDFREVHAYARYWAMGSGASYALGAMYAAWDHAATAREVAEAGVRAGCLFDRGSALPLQVIEIPLAA
jgi:ATP-dependent protease HslVU (ClpYQ) peptidase subunit